MALSPFLCLWAFHRARSNRDDRNKKQAEVAAEEAKHTHKNTQATSRTAIFLILVVILGLSGGLLRGLIGADIFSAQENWLFGAACMVGAAILFLSKAPERGESLELFYRAIALVAISFILLSSLTLHTSFAFAVRTIGFIYFYGLLWVFCSIYSRHNPLPMRVFAGSLMANQIGQFAGALAGNSLFGLSELNATATFGEKVLVLSLGICSRSSPIEVIRPRSR